MIQSFVKMYNSKMKRFIRRAYGGFKSAPSNSISQCGYHHNQVVTATYLSSFVSYSTNIQSVHRFKLGKLDSPVQTCSTILPGVLSRHYCTKNDDKFPRLTKMKCRGYPATLSSFSNFFLSYLVIKPHLDTSFSANEFLYTSKKVVETVSSRIVDADFEALTDLVTTDVLEEIKTNLPKFSVSQRQDLAFTGEELVYSFLDTISLNVDNENSTKTLEILTIHHAFKGIEEVKKIAESFNPFDIESVQKRMKESKPRPYILNYRFVRKFYPTGEADDWIINGIQHLSGKSMKMSNFF